MLVSTRSILHARMVSGVVWSECFKIYIIKTWYIVVIQRSHQIGPYPSIGYVRMYKRAEDVLRTYAPKPTALTVTNGGVPNE